MAHPTQATAERRPKKKMVTRMTGASPSRIAANLSKTNLATQAARALMANRDGTQMNHGRASSRPREDTNARQKRGPSRYCNPNKHPSEDDSFTYDDSTRRDDDSVSSEYSTSTYDSSSDSVTRSDSFSVDRPSTSESRSFDKDERQEIIIPPTIHKHTSNGGAPGMTELSRDTPSVVWEERDEDESTYVKSPTAEVVQDSSNEEVDATLSEGVAKEWGLGEKNAKSIPYNKLQEDEQPLLAISSSASSSMSALAKARLQSDDELDVFHESKEYQETEDNQQQDSAHVEKTSPPQGESRETSRKTNAPPIDGAKHSSIDAMMPFNDVGLNVSEEQSMWQPPMFPEVAMPIAPSSTAETGQSSKYYEARESEHNEEIADAKTREGVFKPDCQNSMQKQIGNPLLSPLRTSSELQRSRSTSPRKRSASASPSKRTKPSQLQNSQEENVETNPNMFEDPSPSPSNPTISPIRKSKKTPPRTPLLDAAEKTQRERTPVIHQKSPQRRDGLTPSKTQRISPNRQDTPAIPPEISSKNMAEKDADQEAPPIVQHDKDVENAPQSLSPRKGQSDPMQLQGSASDDELHFGQKSYPEDILKRMKTPPEQLNGLISVAMTEKSGARRMNACGAFKKLAGVNMRNALSLAWTEGVLIALATILIDPQASNQELIRTLSTLLSMAQVPLNRRIIFLSPNMIDGLARCLKDESSEVFVKAGKCIELLAKEIRNKALMPRKKALMKELCARLDEYVILDKTKDQTVETLTELGLNDTAASFDGERTASVENVALSAMETFLSLSAVVQVSFDLARIDFVMKSLINMSDKVSSKFSSICNGIFANMTQHSENREHLVFKVPDFVYTIVTSAACGVPERRKYACYALQNLSSAKGCRELLGSTENLLPTLAENCLRSDDLSERLAALTALGNLTKHQNNLIHFTSNNCVGTIMALARNKNQPKLQYLASDALVTLSHWMRESTIFALH